MELEVGLHFYIRHIQIGRVQHTQAAFKYVQREVPIFTEQLIRGSHSFSTGLHTSLVAHWEVGLEVEGGGVWYEAE